MPTHLRPLACLLLLSAAGCGSLAGHPLVKEAAEEARVNARVAEALGTPVECGTSIRGKANETDGIAALEFDAKGPKGAGVIVVEGKKTRDEWGVQKLVLRPAGAAVWRRRLDGVDAVSAAPWKNEAAGGTTTTSGATRAHKTPGNQGRDRRRVFAIGRPALGVPRWGSWWACCGRLSCDLGPPGGAAAWS